MELKKDYKAQSQFILLNTGALISVVSPNKTFINPIFVGQDEILQGPIRLHLVSYVLIIVPLQPTPGNAENKLGF